MRKNIMYYVFAFLNPKNALFVPTYMISLLQKNNIATAKVVIFQNERFKFSRNEKRL